MAAIVRISLNAAGHAVWDALAEQVLALSDPHREALRDAVVLVPFLALIEPARAAFARRGGWQPRIETTRTMANSLGPSSPAGPLQLSFDMAADHLVAARLMREQSLGRQWARRDPRRFDRMVSAMVHTAQALAQVAGARSPSAREAYWVMARTHLSPQQGPGAQQRWLARLALEWAAHTPPPATDILFAHRPSMWIALQAGGVDPLVQSVLAEAAGRVRCVVVDADGLRGEAGGAVDSPAVAICRDLEHEAQCAAAQVLVHLEREEWPVALVGLDRQLVRRVRALLERQRVPLADETGWTLSTTRAAAAVLALLRAAAPAARADALFDWLKSSPVITAGTWDDTTLRELERECRRSALARVVQITERPFEGGAQVLVRRIDDALTCLRRSPQSIAAWLADLREALQRFDAWETLKTDDAGAAVVRALRLDPDSGAPSAWRDVHDLGAHSLEGFTAWVDTVFEAASFTPPAPKSDDVRVVVTPLARTMLRPFSAVVCPGADDRHLGAAPVSHPLLSDADLVALGLGGRQERLSRERLAFAHALALPRVTVLRRSADTNGEPLAESPLLQQWQLTHANGRTPARSWSDPRATRSIDSQPLSRPRPSASDGLPTRLSASAVEALRDCPYRFFARHVLGLRDDEELETDIEKRDYGEWMHRVLLAFHRERTQPRTFDQDLDAMVACGRRAQAEMGLADDAFLPFIASFERSAPGYLRWLHVRDAEGARWQAGERDLRIRLAAMDRIELQGVIDRIDSVEMGGALELIDYKTSSAQRLKDKVRQPLEDTQLAFYAALLAAETQVPLRACYLPLDHGEELKPVWHDRVERSAKVLVQALGSELARLRAGAPMLALGEGEVCDTCEARGLCRRDHWPDGALP